MMKKLSLSLLAIAAVSALVMGGTFALFTATATNTGNTFTSGTVKLGEPSQTAFNYANLAPGDHGDDTYTISYSGSLNAFLGLDLTVSGDLLTCSAPNSLQVSVNGTQYTTNASNVQLMNGLAYTFANGDLTTITVSHNFPTAANNDCQNKTASVGIVVHAVQAKNNTTYANPDNTGAQTATSWGN